MPRFYAVWLAIWLLALLPHLAAAAPPTLVIRGLGSGSADITAFVDQVQVLDASGNVVAGAVGDASFEAVSANGSYAYQPTGSAWAFGGSGGSGPGAGLVANGSALAPPPAPDGTQAAFVQRTGYLSQALTLAPGTYRVQFGMAQRPGNAAPQQLQVLVLGQRLGVASLGSSTAYARYTSGTFTVAGGLVGTSPAVNALRAPRQNSALRLAFNPSIKTSTVTNISVYSALVGGLKAGTWSGDGAPTVSYRSTLAGTRGDFQPGEVVSVSVPTTVQTTSGSGVPSQVFQFTAAVDGPGRGNFVAPAASPSFATPAGVSAAVGDVDNDGDLDVLVGSYASGSNGAVLVRLNDGQGNFSGTTSVSVGKTPNALALGDWDGDGNLDFVTANSDDNTVSVRLGDGKGNFKAPYINDPVPVGSSPRGVAIGDVDGDGDLDVLTANYGSNTVTYCNNSGQGFFYNVATVNVGNSPASVALGDVDNDGDLDLLTANSASNTVSVRLNDSQGKFTAPATNAEVAVGSSPTSVAVGDVDGDGALDLLTANSAGTVSVRLNDGTGSFGGGADPAVGSDPRRVVLGDVDSDGDLDLLTANGAAGTVSVRLNDGQGNFAAPASNADVAVAGDVAFGVVLGDVDGDGDLDVFAASSGNTSAVSVRLNQLFPPSLTAASPAAAGVGIPVTLTGTSLGNVTSVTVGGVAATVTARAATSLTFAVPAGAAAGSTSVVATSAGGSASLAFTVLAAPGNALAFDGSNDYVGLPATTVAALQNDFTLEYWVRTTQAGTGNSGDQWWQGTGLLDGDVSGVAADYGTSLLGGRVAFGVGGGSTGNDVTVQSTALVNDGHWHYVVATRQASTGLLALYVDGQAQASATGSTVALTAPPQLTLGVAQTGTTGGNFFAGSLDEVRLWRLVRSASDVAAAYQAGPQTNVGQSGLAAYYSLDEGQPGGSNPDLTTLYDLTASAQHGTLNNFALSGAASNFVASYALVVPTATAATNQTSSSFTATWTAPVVGQLDNYLLDVSATADFNAPIAGSPFSVAAGTTSRDLTALPSGYSYYYRVRAELSSLTAQGAFSNAIAAADPTPLPVQLVAFTAQKAGASAVRLAWTTASELNSAYFAVERSLDGTTFTALGQVAAAGTSATAHAYNYLDASAPAGQLYYRLRQVDRDGTAHYSPVRSVLLAGAGLAVFPNPTRSSASLAGAEAGAPVLVLDALGRLVLQVTADASGVAQLGLPAGLASGVYVVRTGGHSLRLAVE